MDAPRPRPRRTTLLATEGNRHRDRRPTPTALDLAQRRHRDLPGHPDRGRLHDVRIAAVQRGRGPRPGHGAGALALRSPSSSPEALLRTGQPGRGGGGRAGIRRYGGRPPRRPRRRHRAAAVGRHRRRLPGHHRGHGDAPVRRSALAGRGDGLHRHRHQRRAAGVRRPSVCRDRRGGVRTASRPGPRGRRRVGSLRPSRIDGRVRRRDRPRALALRRDRARVGRRVPRCHPGRRPAPPQRGAGASRRTLPRRRLALRRRLDLRHAGRGCRAATC